MRSVTKFVETEIDPHAEEWEEAGMLPAHELFRKMGQQGLLGIHKPEKYRRAGARLLLRDGVLRGDR